MSSTHESQVGHVVGLRVLLAVWGALLILTVVTVAAARVDLGHLNLWLALAIATVKASLVALYFMHLRYDRPFNAVVLVSALLFLMLFIGVAMMDSLRYQPSIQQWQAQQDTQTPASAK